jgi:hypothetical protein
MITKALHPNIEGNPRTNLTRKALAAQADLIVQNAVDFAAHDHVVIGNPAQELTEIRKILSISGKTITLSAVLSNTHAENTRITFIKYDQIKFYKATSINGDYSLVSTKNLAIDEPHTMYDDSTALSTDYFKIKYFNSYTNDLSVFSDPIGASGFPRYALKSIQDAMFKKFGDRKEQFLDRDEMTDWANELKDDMVNQIVDSNEKYFNTFENLSVDANGESALNDRFRKFQKVFVLFDGVNGKRAKKMELEEINDFTQVFNQEFPGYYFKEYNVGVRPKGTVGTTLVQVHFEKQPADMANDMDELDKPMRFYMHVFMDGMMAKGCEKSGKDNRALIYWKKYENVCQNMIEEINNLVLDENRGVRDEEEDAI